MSGDNASTAAAALAWSDRRTSAGVASYTMSRTSRLVNVSSPDGSWLNSPACSASVIAASSVSPVSIERRRSTWGSMPSTAAACSTSRVDCLSIDSRAAIKSGSEMLVSSALPPSSR